MEIAEISMIEGKVTAVNDCGDVRPLQVGDKLLPNESVHTGLDSRTVLTLNDGTTITLSQNDEIFLDSDVISSTFNDDESLYINVASEDDIQNALLNDPNYDPTAK